MNKDRIKKAQMILDICKAKLQNDTEDAGVPLNLLVSSVSLDTGSANRYVKEIIKDLDTVGKIKIIDKKAYFQYA